MANWPCDACEVVTCRELYAHYYHKCDDCKAMKQYTEDKKKRLGEDADGKSGL